MLQILNAKILADDREREIQRQLRERAIRREAEVAFAEAVTPRATKMSQGAGADRRCPDCPSGVAAPAR
jgi:hypothetical protein